MSKDRNRIRTTRFLAQSLLLYGLLYFLFFGVGVVAVLCGCAILKYYWQQGVLPYDLPVAPFVIILMFGGSLLIYKMYGSLSAIRKIDRPDLKEITRMEYPALFALIEEIAGAMRVKPPQRIYLSATASASVFLNTGFWSAFFPTKKKLEIGLGLIRFLNHEELRAVLAHELGHFSQRSMTLNASVYVIGQSIRYLTQSIRIRKRAVLKDQSYILAYLFRGLADLLFARLSKDFASFSDELEYDADKVAVEYVGKEALVSALLKVSFASQMFDHTLYNIHALSHEGKGVSDFYRAQYYTAFFFLHTKQVAWNSQFISRPLPGCSLSRLTKRRLERLQGDRESKKAQETVVMDLTGLFPDYKAECVRFSHAIYRYQLGTEPSDLHICTLSLYSRKMSVYFDRLESQKEADTKIEVEIMLEKKLHRTPLTELYFDVYWDRKNIGRGRCRKGFVLKIKVDAGVHRLEIEGQYIRNTPMRVMIENKGKYILKLDYEHLLMKAEYRFSIKEMILDDNSQAHR